MAQLAIAAAATVAFGPAGLGLVSAGTAFAIGSFIGAQLTAPDMSTAGPREADLKLPRLEYGAPIPRVYGRIRTAGILAWQSPVREVATTTEVGGKGGGSVSSTTYTYYRSILLVLADGTNGVGITRVWINKKLVWNNLADASPDTVDASAAQNSFGDLRFYNGAADQLPDPLYEADVGTANAIGWRNRATVVFEDVYCGGTKQLPLIEVELLTAGTPGSGEAFDVIGHKFGVGTTPILPDGVGIGDNVLVIVGARNPIAGLPGYEAIGQQSVSGGGAALAIFGRKLDGTTADTDVTFTCGAAGGAVWATIAFSGTLYGGSLSAFPSGLPLNFASEVGVINPGAVGATGDIGDNQLVLAMALTEHPINHPIIGAPPGYTLTALSSAVDALSFTHQLAVAYKTGIAGGSENPASFIDDGTGFVTSFRAASLMIGYGATVGAVADTVDLADVVAAECRRAGLLDAQFDVEDLRGQAVYGFYAQSSAREAIEELRAAYFFDAVCTDKLRFVMRGGDVAGAVDWSDTAAGVESSTDEPFVGVGRDNDIEQPAKVDVAYVNLNADYDAGSEHADIMVGPGNKVQKVGLAHLVWLADRARGAAETIAADARLGSMRATVAVDDGFAKYEPTDVVTIAAEDGRVYERLRIDEVTYRDGVLQWDVALDGGVLALVRSAPTSDTAKPVGEVLGPPSATYALLDIPILRDADNAAGLYVAAQGAGDYHGEQVLRAVAVDAEYVEVARVTDIGVVGTTVGALAASAAGNVFDTINTVDVTVGSAELTSSTRDALLDSAAGAFAIGAHGRWEIVQATDVELLSNNPNVYRLSGLLRGRLGTEWAIGTHVAGDTVVRLPSSGSGLRRVLEDLTARGATRYYKGVPIGTSASGVTPQTFVNDDVGLKPYAPVDLRVNRNTPGVLQVTWSPRTRLAWNSLSGSVMPVGEASESYSVDLLNASNVVIGTSTVATPSWTTATALQSLLIDEGVWALREVGGSYYGIGLEGPSGGSKFILKQDAGTGDYLERGIRLGAEVYAHINVGGSLYVAIADYTNTTPPAYLSGAISRYATSNLLLEAATHVPPIAGDYWGIGYDGADIWGAQRFSNQISRLNVTTLGQSAVYAVAGGPTAMTHDSGALYICCASSNEVVKWNIAGTAQVWRVSVGSIPGDVLVASGLVYVATVADVRVLNASTGALVASYPTTGGVTLLQGRALAVLGSNVISFVRTPSTVLLMLDAATGAEVQRLSVDGTTIALAGAIGSSFFLATSPTFSPNAIDTRKFDFGGSLTGHKVRVHQLSAAVGRGYPAEVTL